MKTITVLVGPCGSGKSTLREVMLRNDPSLKYISQDEQGKHHLDLFKLVLEYGESVIVDRMGFSKQQRDRYLVPAKAAGYRTEIIVLHENSKTCLERVANRKGHPTIQDAKSAGSALHTFFKGYERPQPSEADEIIFKYPEGLKLPCIVSDIDNTLADATHREHYVNTPGQKKNWKGFFDAMGEDKVNQWCDNILYRYKDTAYTVLLVSARPDNYRKITESWLSHNDVHYDELIMRQRDDFRKDDIVKEIILDFEIKTRFEVVFWLDDRKQVIDKIRSRGVIVLDCAGEKGNF
jgi:gluconate kinase